MSKEGRFVGSGVEGLGDLKGSSWGSKGELF